LNPTSRSTSPDWYDYFFLFIPSLPRRRLALPFRRLSRPAAPIKSFPFCGCYHHEAFLTASSTLPFTTWRFFTPATLSFGYPLPIPFPCLSIPVSLDLRPRFLPVLLLIQGSSSPCLHFIRLGQRLTFPFPFVHLQPLDGKLEELLTVETKSHIHGEWCQGLPGTRKGGWDRHSG